MAAAAQDALVLDQSCGFLGVATGAGDFAPVLLVGCRPTQAFLFMAEVAGLHRLGQGMVAKRRHGHQT